MNFRAMSEPYTPADEKLLYVMNEQIRPHYCRMCYECKGQCPKGMPVTDVLRFLAYNDFGGNYHQAAGELQRSGERSPRCALQRLFCLRHQMPEWSPCPGSPDPGAGASGIAVLFTGEHCDHFHKYPGAIYTTYLIIEAGQLLPELPFSEIMVCRIVAPNNSHQNSPSRK